MRYPYYRFRLREVSLCRIFFLLVCLSFLLPLSAKGQTWFFDNYGVPDGLTQSKIYDLIQDERGYIWLATAAGVSVFDGITFTNYSVADGLSPGVARTILQDSKGNIWIGHHDGRLSIYNGKEFLVPPVSGNELQRDITSFIETEKGEIWISSHGSGIMRIDNPYDDPGEFSFEHYTGGTISPLVSNSYKGRDGTLYFITNLGISTYNEDENIFEPFRPEKLPRYFSVICMFEDVGNNYWFGTHNGGLYKIHRHSDELTIYDARDGLAHNMISYITEDSRENIWAGTWGGGITRISGDELKTFTVSNGLSDNEIRSIAEDTEGNILIATNNNGLDIYKGDHFLSYGTDDGLVDPQVWAFHQDSEGKYWIGTQGGISIYNPHLPDGGSFQNLTELNGFSLERVRFIREDRNNNIWISTDRDGIGMYNKETGIFQSRKSDFINLQLLPGESPNPTALEIDRDNNLWIGTNSNVSWYNIDSGDNGVYTQGAGIAGNDISALFLDSKGVLWVGSSGRGLATISNDMQANRVLPDEVFTPLCITEGPEGNIWIGTESQGVIVTNGDSIIITLDISKGLLGNYISLITAHDDNIYIGTSRGLNRYSIPENRIYTYTQRNGFTGIEALRNASFVDSENRIWFGTIQGAMVFDPSVYRKEFTEPLTHLTGLRVNYADRVIEDGIELGYRENSIIFDYNSISLTNPDAVRFRVMLTGADPDWRPVTRETTAIYPGLSPGRYEFKLMASNSQDIWNEEPVTLSFRIRPPWYASWWGISFFIIAGMVILVVYIKIRERTLRKEKRVLEEKVAERTKEISIKNDLLAMKNKDITDSINYAKRLQDAILPAEEMIKDSFVMFWPKDIVSGDFYWIMILNGTELVAAVDCTGHGVPGAFMSIIGHNGLNKIVKEMNIIQPGNILDKLNEEVYTTLHQNIDPRDDVKDGMDLSVISYDKKNGILEYAGAYNSLYLVRNGELIEYKADKFAIGQSLTDNKYSNHEINIEKGDTVYIFSDGFADQFGGEKGKKFMSKNLKRLLVDINKHDMKEQKAILERTLRDWMGNQYEQLDDVLIIGRRF